MGVESLSTKAWSTLLYDLSQIEQRIKPFKVFDPMSILMYKKLSFGVQMTGAYNDDNQSNQLGYSLSSEWSSQVG